MIVAALLRQRVYARRIFFSCLAMLFITLSADAQQTITHLGDNGLPLAKNDIDTNEILLLLKKAESLKVKYPDSMVALYEQALWLSTSALYGKGMIASSRVIYFYRDKGQFDKALLILNRLLTVCTKSPVMWKMIPVIYNDIGGVYNIQGNFIEAAKYMYQALQLSEQTGTVGNGMIELNLADIMGRLGKFDRAFYYYDKAEASFTREAKYRGLTLLYTNKGHYYLAQGQLDKSIYFFEKALQISEKYNYGEEQHQLISVLATVYVGKNMPFKALAYLQTKLLNDTSIVPPLQKINRLWAWAGYYYAIHDYQRAADYYKNAINIVHVYHIQPLRILHDAYNNLSVIYDTLGEKALALKYLKEYVRIKDSISELAVRRNIAQLDAKYQTAQKDKDLLQKQLLISKQETVLKQKNIWIALATIVSLLLIIVLRSYRRKQHRQKEQLHIFEQNREIDQLRAMVQGEEGERTRIARELHDGIVSKLHGIRIHLQDLMEQGQERSLESVDLTNTERYLADATDELRKVAQNLLSDTLLQNGLAAAIKSFCWQVAQLTGQSILFQSFGEHRRLDINIELSIYRIVQELVHNAVKHANAKQIVVQLNFKNKVLYVTVEDDGIGYQSMQLATHMGMGIKNIYARVKMINGVIDWQSQPGKGTSVHMEFHIIPFSNFNRNAHPVNYY